MNTFLRQGLKEKARNNQLKIDFEDSNRKIANAIRKAIITADTPDFVENYERRCLILLAPLVEVAWADGSIKTREMEAVFHVADSYNLAENEEIYAELIDSMMSRATDEQKAGKWRQFHDLWRYFASNEREEIGFSLVVQARYVAEQCSNSVVGYFRGNSISENENEAIKKILDQLNEARNIEPVPHDFVNEESLTDTDILELLPIIPLVKVAWAEGRITNRERELIFQAAEKNGIAPDSYPFQRLSDWLELHPTDDFYLESLELLSEQWKNLPDEERTLRHLELLSDCTNIAEASGGTYRYAAGGPRVCDEEISAVRRIAEKINIRSSVVG
jgi:uncharacterized tellurite resistance protein B-like protein